MPKARCPQNTEKPKCVKYVLCAFIDGNLIYIQVYTHLDIGVIERYLSDFDQKYKTAT